RRARQPGGARAWPVPPRRRVTDARGTCRSDHAVARLEALAGGAAGALAAGARAVSMRRRTRGKEDSMMNARTAVDDRDPMDPVRMASLKHWGELPEGTGERMTDEAKVDCGWGRLIFGQTYASPERLAEDIRRAEPGRRDVAPDLRDPHVVVALAPQQLFLDPSHTFRLALQTAPLATPPTPGVVVRDARPDDEAAVN